MEKPEEQPKAETSVESIREERQRRKSAEPGYKTGKELGKHLRSSTLLMLPFQMALAPVLVTLGGYWLDKWLDTFPWFTVGGLVFGLTVAVRAVIGSIKEVQD
ncbi:MAG: AtpZ/AtpI family protein [bacterium]